METERLTAGRLSILWRLGARLADDGFFGRGLAAIALVSAWVVTWRPQIDPDFGWHRAVGEMVLATGTVPRTDTFSWLTAGQPFVAHSWAWDVLLTLADRAAGLMGTSLLAIPLAAVAIALTWYLIGLAAPGVPPFPRAVLVGLGIVIGLPIWTPRPQVWDVVLVLACAAAWSTWLRHGRIRALAVVPVITIVWVNLHGGSALAFVACVLALVVAVPVGVRWGTWPRRPIRPLIVSTAVALVALVLNPYGVGILGLAVNGDVGNAFLPDIAEWQPPRFDDVGFAALRIALAALILVAFALRGRRRDPLILLLAAGWTFMALGASRFSLIAGPLLVIALAPAFGGSGRAWLDVHLAPDRDPERRDRAAAGAGVARLAGSAALVIAVLIGLAGLIQIVPARQSAAIKATYPVDAVGAMLDRGCHGRLLNAYDWGGYLIAAWTDQVATYGSSPKDIVGVEAQLERVEIDPSLFLDEHRVELVLMPTDGPLTRWLAVAPGWSVAYRDSQATLNVRDGSTVCAGVPAQILSAQ